MLQKLGGLVLVVAIAAGFYWWKSKKSEAVDTRIDEVQEKVVQVCKNCPSFSKHVDFFHENAYAAHERAFDAAYSAGGRRRSPTFDESEYCRLYFKALIGASERANKPDLTTELRQAQSTPSARWVSLPVDEAGAVTKASPAHLPA